MLTIGPEPNADGQSTAGTATAEKDAIGAVNQASQQLNSIDRASLTESGAEEYGLIAAMVKSAQRALHEKDFLRAQRLAGKASVLAVNLANSPAKHR